jgi:hypothetical protein
LWSLLGNLIDLFSSSVFLNDESSKLWTQMKTKHKENYTIPLKLKQLCFKHGICAGGLITAFNYHRFFVSMPFPVLGQQCEPVKS